MASTDIDRGVRVIPAKGKTLFDIFAGQTGQANIIRVGNKHGVMQSPNQNMMQ